MNNNEQEFSFKSLFIPLTTFKAIHIIIIVGFIVYFNSLFNGFVWDDKIILQVPTFKTLNIFYLFGPNDMNIYSHYRPLSVVYYAVLYHLFHNNAFFYHLAQISLHIATTCLIFLIFTVFFSRSISFILALFFLIHPINVESVAYIAATQNQLSTVLGLSALILNIRAKETTNRKIIIIFTLLFLSILAKESGILFLIFLFIYEYFFKKKHIKKYLFFGASITGFYLILRFLVGHIFFEKLSFITIQKLTFIDRLQNIPAIIFYYLKTVIYPANLAVGQIWVIRERTFSQFYLPLMFDFVFLVIAIVIGFYFHKKHKKLFHIYLLFTFWFILSFGFHINIIPLDMTVADRWFYIPLIGFLGIIGILVKSISLRNRTTRNIIITMVVIMLMVYSVRTVYRSFDWKDNITLYSQALKTQNNFMIETDLAMELMDRGDTKQALFHAYRSVELYPNDKNLLNLANIYERMGNIQKAMYYYGQSSTIKTYSGHNRHTLDTAARIGRAFILYGDTNYAVKLLEQYDNEYSAYSTSYLLKGELAIAYYKLGNKNKAIDTATKAHQLYPNPVLLTLINLFNNNSNLHEVLKFLEPSGSAGNNSD